jgi:hypothetical protein
LGYFIFLAIGGLIALLIARHKHKKAAQREREAAEMAAIVNSVVPAPPGTRTLEELPANHPLTRAVLWWVRRRGVALVHAPGHPYWTDVIPYDDRWYWFAKGHLQYANVLLAESARRHEEWLNGIAMHNQPLYFAVQQFWQKERHQAQVMVMQQAQLAMQQQIAQAAQDAAFAANADRRYYDSNGTYIGRSSR